MTTKRNKVDLVMPVSSNHHTDPQLSNNTEIISTTTDNRLIKDDITSTVSGSNKTSDIPKKSSSARYKVEILRANSPTLKRLIAVRNKLDKYITSNSTSRQSTHAIHDKTYSSNQEKQPIINVHTSSAPQKQTKSQIQRDTGPADKITYEKTLTNTGNVKKKCSLEIWLPKASCDDDDGNTSRTTSPDPTIIGKKIQTPRSVFIRSRRPSTIKVTTTATTNIETKSLDDVSSKKSEPTIIPRVYHYEDYLSDPPEERPRSSKSSNTTKSDGNVPNKNIKRQRTRSHGHRLSSSNNHTEESAHSTTTALPMSSKNLLANIKQTSSGHESKGVVGSNNSLMINELMRKYTMIKQNHQELTQARLQLEKPYHESKHSTHITKDHTLPSVSTSESTSCISSDHPTVSVKKLLGDVSPPRSAVDHNNTNTKLLDRRSSRRKPSYAEIFPQTNLLSIVNHLQHRQTSASMPSAILPAVIGKKNEDSFRSLQRSKTLDVVSDVSNDSSNKIPSRLPVRPDSPENTSNSSNLLPHTNNEIERTSPRISKRSLPPPLLTLRSEQQQQQHQVTQPLVQLVQYQNVQNSAQRYHHTTHTSSSSTTTTTDASTNKVLVHLKYSNSGNTDRNCLVPE